MYLDWEKLFQNLPNGLLVLDADRQVVYCHPEVARLAGRPPEEMSFVPFSKAFEKNQALRDPVEKCLKGMGAGSIRDLSCSTPTNDPLFYDIHVGPLWDDAGTFYGWALTFQEITRLKQLEEKRQSVDRLALMGTIATGLAHEIRNPLSGIKGAAQLLSRQNQKPESQKYLDIILKETERVNQLIKELLNFTKPNSRELQAVNIHQLLNSILKLQEETLEKNGIELIREYDPSLPAVWGDEDRLTQAFLNFIKNSLEAMPHGGRLTLHSRMASDYRIREGNQVIQMIAVEIRDTGCGIPEEDLDKIFSPFFTRKRSGCGLGLSIAQKILHEQGGTVQVQSEPGTGTVFTLYLRTTHE
ncbi:MAG: ATP-binding protein [bacterium]|nr:ATP-binding protein [bacterium]